MNSFQYAQRHNCNFFETSALTDINIDQVVRKHLLNFLYIWSTDYYICSIRFDPRNTLQSCMHRYSLEISNRLLENSNEYLGKIGWCPIIWKIMIFEEEPLQGAIKLDNSNEVFYFSLSPLRFNLFTDGLISGIPVHDGSRSSNCKQGREVKTS